MSDSATSWTVALQALLSMRFPRQEILEWVAISFSRGSSWPRDQTSVSCIGRRILYQWATWETLSGFTSRYIRRIRGQQRTRWLDGMTDSMDMGLSKLQEMVKDKETWHAPGHGGHKESDTTEQQYKELSLERSLWQPPEKSDLSLVYLFVFTAWSEEMQYIVGVQ